MHRYRWTGVMTFGALMAGAVITMLAELSYIRSMVLE